MGVTGTRTTTSDLAGPLVARTKAAVSDLGADLPVGVGLGVSNGDQAAEVAAYADGVIVGSAFVRALLDHPDDRAAGLRALAALTEDLAEGVAGVRRRGSPRPAPGADAAHRVQRRQGGDRAARHAGRPAVHGLGGAARRHRRRGVLADGRHREAADHGVLRLHRVPGHLRQGHGQPLHRDDPARAGRPGAGRGRVRDDRPGARHRRGAPRLPRRLRPGVPGAHRRPHRHREGGRLGRRGSRRGAARAAATTSTRTPRR